MRGILAIAVVVVACFFNFKLSPHHDLENPFQVLYMHLMPAPLVTDNHAPHDEQELLMAVPLPGALAFMDVGVGGEGEHGPRTALFNFQIFQIAAVLLIFICFGGVPNYLRTGQGGGWLTRTASGFAMWVRDEVVVPVMGQKDGTAYLPYFLCVFFFLLFMNLMGLVPGSSTPTASIWVTAGMALTTLTAMLVLGMAKQGVVKFWINLVPHVPVALWPLMFIVEVVGLFVKPFALMIRLFANMSGGHMVVLSFMGLIFYFAGAWGAGGGYGASPVAVGFAVFIMIIEVFVAMLQAYIFTQLSVIFINQSLHAEH